MNTKNKIFVLIAILVFSGAPIALAHAHEKGNGKESQETRAEVKIENKNENELKNEVENENRENRFEIRGEITSISGNTFVVLGQTITIDPSKVREFEQKGILEVGKIVKIEGNIVDGTKFAQEINVLGTGQGRFKIEIKDGQTLTTLLSPSPSPSTTITPTATSTPSSDVKIEVKARGTSNVVIKFLNQILSFLKGLI